MHPPELLVPFQLLGRIALAVHEIENTTVFLVPAIVYHAQRNFHALVDDVLPMQPKAQIHHEPQRFQIVSGIHAAAFETVHQGAVRGQVFHHDAQIRLIKDIKYLMQGFLDGLAQQGLVLDDGFHFQGHVTNDHGQGEILHGTRSGNSLAPLPFGIGAALQNTLEHLTGHIGIMLTAGGDGQLCKGHAGEGVGENVVRSNNRLSLARK